MRQLPEGRLDDALLGLGENLFPHVASSEIILEPGARAQFLRERHYVRAGLERRPFVQLTAPSDREAETRHFWRRRSDRAYLEGPVPYERFCHFLSLLREEEFPSGPKRRYGSAGATYAVQVYIHVREGHVEGIPQGVYWYHPVANRLIVLSDGWTPNGTLHFPANEAWASGAAFTLFLVGDLSAIEPLYGGMSRDFLFIEAGLIAQLLESEGPAVGVGLCQVGAVNFDVVRPVLELDGAGEFLYTLVCGPVAPRQAVHADSGDAAHGNGHRRLHEAISSARALNQERVAEFERELSEIWCRVLHRNTIDLREQFFDAGGTSLQTTQIAAELQDKYPCQLDVADLFSHATIHDLARLLAQRTGAFDASGVSEPATAPPSLPHAVRTARTPRRATGGIAIIGMAGRFPGAPDLESFWRNLESGVCSAGPLPPGRARLVPFFKPTSTQTYRGNYIDDVDKFDPLYFHISPKEARRMDPAQRLLLEICCEAVERAGYGGRLRGTRTGLFVGAGASEYWRLLAQFGDQQDLTRLLTGNMPAILANRVSHFLDLRGPSFAIDTACSSSLVAVDTACRAILDGDCQAALVASVNLLMSPGPFDAFRSDGMESATGYCRTFDRRADGFVRGEGVAAIMLKPLEDAQRDGDPIMAVILGSATNHDGSTNSVSVPNPVTQQEVVSLAQARAGVDGATISYVEAHGTATPLGDPIEISGLTRAFRQSTDKRSYCAIGSVKSNIGHLEYAAGIAGLIKTVLALQHKKLPPSLHFETPNPHIDFANSPFYVVDRVREWRTDGPPRRAAVSSFGVGGANAHVILEEAPAQAMVPVAGTRPHHLFVLSARNLDALLRLAERYLDYFNGTCVAPLQDICHTAGTGRAHHACRLAIVATDIEQLSDKLSIFFLSEGKREAWTSRVCFGHAHGNGVLSEGERDRLTALFQDLDAIGAAHLTAWCTGDLFDREVRPLLPIAEPTGPAGAADWKPLYTAMAYLYCLGVEIDWDAVYAGTAARRVSLPTYAFARESIWVEDALTAGADAAEFNRGIAAETSSKTATDDHAAALNEAPVVALVPTATRQLTEHEVRELLVETVGNALEMPKDWVQIDQPLIEMGMDSVTAVRLIDDLNRHMPQPLPQTFFFEHPTIADLARVLVADFQFRAPMKQAPTPVKSAAVVEVEAPARLPAVLSDASRQRTRLKPGSDERSIAIIGMAGRFPGAPDLDTLWRNLQNGVDSVTEVPRDRWNIDKFFDPDPNALGKTYGRWGAFIDGVELFDPTLFRISVREAKTVGPQQRHLLEVTHQMLESAGYGGKALFGSQTGVFVGSNQNHFSNELLRRYGNEPADAHIALGLNNAIQPGRISYAFNLRGPCVMIDTLCSSALVAVHAAMQALRTGECDYAIVASAHLGPSPLYYETLSRLRALSALGRCRTFDRRADGYVPGEGAAAILLRPLKAALASGDQIHAVIRGGAVNHGGQSSGLTVPNPIAQSEVICAAMEDAGVSPKDISYVEVHGTGTRLGDPIEVAGLCRAFAGSGIARQSCAIGSIKSNIGHQEQLAGLAGLIKAVLALKAGQLPPSLHVSEPNPQIVFEDSPFYVVDRLEPWKTNGPARRAGVSSFGLAGTNAHVVLEEAPPPAPRVVRPLRSKYLFVLSAQTERILEQAIDRYVNFLATTQEDFADICYTAAVGREHMLHRIAVLAGNCEELRQQLGESSPDPTRVFRGARRQDKPLSAEEFEIIGSDISRLSTAARAVFNLCVRGQLREQLGCADERCDDGAVEKLSDADRSALAPLLARLYCLGADLDLRYFCAESGARRIAMPLYPSQRLAFPITIRGLTPGFDEDPAPTGGASIPAPATPSKGPHPLLDDATMRREGNSTIFEREYSLNS